MDPFEGKAAESKFYRSKDWSQLTGTSVAIRRDGKTIRVGTIDDATADGSIVWIAQEGALERSLLRKADGYEICTLTAPLHGAAGSVN